MKSYKCNIEGCATKNNESISIIGIPLRPEIRELWINAIEQNQEFDFSVYNFRGCALHFSPNQIIRRGARCDIINNTAPTIFLNKR